MPRPRRSGVAAVAALGLVGALACMGADEPAEHAAPQEYEAALVERLVQLADEELSQTDREAGPYCAARVDSVRATTTRDPAEAVLAPATAEGRRVLPISECGSFERPAVDGEPAALILILPVDPASPDTVVGGYRLGLANGAATERFFSCPVAGAEVGVRLGVCVPRPTR